MNSQLKVPVWVWHGCGVNVASASSCPACCSRLDPLFDLIVYVANRVCVARRTGLYLCGAWLRNLFSVSCEWFLPDGDIFKKKNLFLRACLLTRTIFYCWNILLDYFYELKRCFDREKKKTLFMRRHPNLGVWLPHTNPDDLFYGKACYSQYG